jgi:hypothetical protein
VRRIQLQLHAVPEDVLDWIELLQAGNPEIWFYGWHKQSGLKRILPGASDSKSVIEESSVVAALHDLAIDGRSLMGLLDENPGILVMDVPKISNGELVEVSIGALDRDGLGATQISQWEKFIRKFRKTLTSGAEVVNERLGKSAFYKNAHATSRALSAARAGTRLLAPGGNLFLYADAGRVDG